MAAMPASRRLRPWSRKCQIPLNTEPQDLRVVRRQLVMEQQNVETNGCDESPKHTSAVNHAGLSQGARMEKQGSKTHAAKGNKKTRNISGNSKAVVRSRRSAPTVPPISLTVSTVVTSEKRVKRNVPVTPTKILSPTRTFTVSSERKSSKNSQPILSIRVQSNKKSSRPPVLSPEISSLSSQDSSPDAPVSHNLVNSKRSKQLQNSSVHSAPPLLISQKRHIRNTTAAETEASERASKRIRLQHQPFQSPPPPSVIPAILRHTSKTTDDKICVFQRGEFLAVRNENGSFFVCRTAQNVYKSSKRFKIQWMSDKESDIYIPDFYDQTDFECVLTNLRMKRVDKNKYKLPSDERQRTLNILQRALNVENGIDVAKLQITTDGVDVSIVGKEEEGVLRLRQQSLKAEQKQKALQARNRGRPRKSELSPTQPDKKATPAQKRIKSLAAKVKLRSKETVKVKLKKEGEQVVVSNKTGKPLHKVQKNIERLHPNPKVTVFEKDPTFELNLQVPYVSSSAHSKLLIRAVLLKDMKLLQSLIKDTRNICSLNCCRSVDVSLTALAYAVLEEDHKMMRVLLSAENRKYANPPETLLEYQGTGRYNYAMLGHFIKPITTCRGGREGNNAFLKDSSSCDETYPHVDASIIKEALRVGVSRETLNLLSSDNMTRTCQRDEILQHIIIAIRNGHYKLAGQLVSEAVDRGGYGFSFLHKEVLTKERQPLSNFKPVSVIKKAIGHSNGRVTPLHCSAINPNPQYLSTLLSTMPEYNLSDENGWRVIHYAAVCSGTGPLELLISRGISVDEVDSEGNTPLHASSAAGRARNSDLILKHLTAIDHGKKDVVPSTLNQDKFNVAVVDRGNKKSFTPLHLACQNGFADVVSVLLRHKANIDKFTNAQHDKMTSLMLAAQKGHLKIVQLLIENNAQVEIKDKKQRTALTHAVINGHAHVTSYLLRLGANPNSTDSSGNTLVHYAAAYGWYFCLKLLIEAGASLNLPNDWKITPLSVAFMKGHMGLVDFLVEQPGIDINVDVNNENGMTLVMQALRSRVNHSMLERIHFLVVKQKSDCAKVDFMGNNALHHLVMAEVEEMKHGINMEDYQENYSWKKNEDSINLDEDLKSTMRITEKNKEQQLLKEEAQQEHDALLQEITKLLLDNGCDPVVKNKEGESSFNMAVKEGCLLLVKMFLDAGCQLSLDVSNSGDNILHYLVAHACNRKVEPMLQAILNAKCSDSELTPHQLLCQMAKMYNKNGLTPLLLALNTLKNCHCEEGRNRLLSFIKFLLDELGADVAAPCKSEDGKELSYPLHLSALCHSGRVTEALLSHKPPLNSYNSGGKTPLLIAIETENVEAIEALIKAGAAVNLKSKGENCLSPLLLAAQKPNLGKIVQLLVQNKADVDDVDPKNKNTALHYVVSIRAADVLETVKALLIAGANSNAVNDKKRTPLHLSINASSSDSDASYAAEECLLGFGAAVDIVDCRGRMPLHYAFTKIGRCRKCSRIDPTELVVLILGAMSRAAVEAPDNDGCTLLHAAAFRGATISCTRIASQMRNIDVRDNNGNTALSLSVRNGHESCSLMLLQLGASCIADVVIDDFKDISTAMEDSWIWQHVQPKPPKIEKHTILQETLIKDWQGIFFLMLEKLDTSGKGIVLAVESALRSAKYNVALKLISKVKNSWILYSDKQSVLHVLAREASPNYLPDLQVKVANFLSEKGVPPAAKDEHGCSGLTYASVNWNLPLCAFFSSKMSIIAAAQADPDKSLRTPFSAIFWKITRDELSEDIRNWCTNLVKAGANPNILTKYPISTSSFPGVRCTQADILHSDVSTPKISPLIMAIYKQNYSAVKLLISLGADVNFPDENLQTPLMHAVRLNDMKMVKLLLNWNYDPYKDKIPGCSDEFGNFQKTSPLCLTDRDVSGFTVVHHLVCPLPDYCYSDCSVLYLLAEMGAPLDMPNNSGETPLQMAVRLQRQPIICTLQELLNVPDEKRLFPEPIFSVADDGINWDVPSWDYRAESKAFLQKLENQNTDSTQSSKPLPDALSGLKDKGEVVFDASKNIPYDLLMTVVDLNYGAYGIYNFYKMQIIKHIEKDFYLLFTCWGRVGDVGQYQKTPFNNLPDVVKEFCRIFRSKSGNHWDDILNFQPQPKKYRIVELQKRKQVTPKSIKLNLTSTLPSKLNEQLQKLMDDVMNVHIMENTLHHHGIESTFDALPFGNLTENSLAAAQNILQEIGNVVVEKDGLQQNLKSQEKFSELMHKIIKLSEEFYQLIPIFGYEYERLRPLFGTTDVHEKMSLIYNLLNIGLAGEMLLAAHFRNLDINPKDYVYRSTGCKLQPLDRLSQEAQMILQYIYNTSLDNKPTVECIYAVHRPDERENLKKFPNSQRILLWHGTPASNVLGILSRGLQTAPLGVRVTGNLFGKGIYLADMFVKSRKYCFSNSNSGASCMLLCEAALGKVKETDSALVIDSTTQCDSIKALGRTQPDPAECVSWQGVAVPLGHPIDALMQHNTSQHRFLNFNEYVVRNSTQVCIRYLIQFS